MDAVNFFDEKFGKTARAWHKFSQNYLSTLGLSLLTAIILLAILAPYIAPYPDHAGAYTNFPESNQPPSLKHLFGTDSVGRDVLTRVIFGYRFSLILGVVVLSLAVPPGILLGLMAGYYEDTWIEIIIMRITDIFLSLPPLVLALSVVALLNPNLTNQMIAIALGWWAWYCRLVYSNSRSLSKEEFIIEAKLIGASKLHILFREILPNCIGPILTKMSLDMGFVILVGATLSFIGLGIQPPRPGLGTMIARGAKDLPSNWWLAVFPGIAITLLILSFNLIGDGLGDMFGEKEA